MILRGKLQDKADVQLLLKAGEESHAFEPTVNDILAIKNSDIFICIGLV